MYPYIGTLNGLETLEEMLREKYNVPVGSVFTHQYKEGSNVEDIFDDLTFSDKLFIATDTMRSMYFFVAQGIIFTNLSFSNVLLIPVESNDERRYFAMIDDISALEQVRKIDNFEDSATFAAASFLDHLFNDEKDFDSILLTLKKVISTTLEERTHTSTHITLFFMYALVALKKYMYRDIKVLI